MHELPPLNSQEVVCSENIVSPEGYLFSVTTFASGFIQISTEPRQSFLEKGNEYRVYSCLVGLAYEIRERNGGTFEIDPWFGAVKNSRVCPLLPLGPSTNNLKETLSMRIFPDGEESPNLQHMEVAKQARLLGKWHHEFRKFNSHLRQPAG